MAKLDGLLFKSTSPMSPPHPPQSAVAGRLLWQPHRERERSRGYIKAAPWTVQTSLDQWPAQWLLLRSGASSVRARRKAGTASFHWRSSSQPRSTGGKEGREGRHLLPWLRPGYGDPTIEEAPFSCSHWGNVTHFKNASGCSDDWIHKRQPFMRWEIKW